MKKQYNILISERKSVPRSKRLREAGQSASSAAVPVSGNAGGAGLWQCVSMMPYAPKTGWTGDVPAVKTTG